ncbi:MAG: hypothetical protein H0Z25_10125 [Kosmotoga sp.]|uniref:hypothetical protein n=1 Tax=Kosmotoga sp. TaxID=1955248 RepID=UPI001D32B69B|nr:hypothetical protein [Kosmotoga sp.]MBO8167545.1 hypothetical protein [Kosmotoga sp.]
MRIKILILFLIVILFTSAFAGFGAFYAKELDGRERDWIGLSLKGSGSPIAISIDGMIEMERLMDGDFSYLNVIPSIDFVIGDKFKIFAGLGTLIEILGTNINFDYSTLYPSIGVAVSLGKISLITQLDMITDINDIFNITNYGIKVVLLLGN